MAFEDIQWGPVQGGQQLGVDLSVSRTVRATDVDVTLQGRYYIRFTTTAVYEREQTLYVMDPTGTYSIAFTAKSTAEAGNYIYIYLRNMYDLPIYFDRQTRYGVNLSTPNPSGGQPAVTATFDLPLRPQSVPSASAWLSLKSRTQTQLVLAWAESNNDFGSAITADRLQVANDSNFNDLVYDQIAEPSTRTRTVTGLLTGRTYYARYAFRNGIGWGNWQSAGSPFATAPGVPEAVPSVSVSNVLQSQARLSWPVPMDNGAPITRYDIQLATNTAFTTGVRNETHDSNVKDITALSPGVQYYARVRAVNSVGAGSYSPTVALVTTAGVPYVEPGSSTARGDGTATQNVVMPGWFGAFTIEVQTSTSSTFSTAGGVPLYTTTRVVAETENTTDSVYAVLGKQHLLPNGTYYVRVRGARTGYTSAWSPSFTYKQTHDPIASVFSPSSDRTVEYKSAGVMLTWLFRDSATAVGNPANYQGTDGQTAYEIIVENNATGAIVLTTGKVDDLVASSYSWAPLASLKNIQLRWKVRVWDKLSQVGPWSGYALFTLRDAPVVTIQYPTTNINTSTPTFDWTGTYAPGDNQDGATVVVTQVSNGREIWRGTTRNLGASLTPSTAILLNGVQYSVAITVKSKFGLSGTTTKTFSSTFVAPGGTSYFFDSSLFEQLGYVVIDWSATTPDLFITGWRVYRKEIGVDLNWKLLVTLDDRGVREYRDWLVKSGANYQYAVTQLAARAGNTLESPVGTYIANPQFLRVNLARNPRAKGTVASLGLPMLAQWSLGTGEAGVVTRRNPVDGYAPLSAADGPLPYIDHYARFTVTTAKTAGTSGFTATAASYRVPAPGAVGDQETISIWVRYTGSTASIAGFLTGQFNTSSSAVVGTSNGANTTLLSGVWTRLTVTITATGIPATVGWRLQFGSAVIMPVGSTFDIAGLLIESGSATNDYFDGGLGVPSSAFYTRFTGTEDASTSEMRSAEVPEDRVSKVDSSSYWLIAPGRDDLSMRVPGVKGDSFRDEYEQATYGVIGRGRRKDYGTRWGVTGTLDIGLRGATARSTRQALQRLREQQVPLYMRNPFGDLFRVALGDPSVSFLGSTGPTEMSDVQLPYEEVF